MKDQKQQNASDTDAKTTGGASGARKGAPPSPGGHPVKARKSSRAAQRDMESVADIAASESKGDSLAAAMAKVRTNVCELGDPVAAHFKRVLSEHPEDLSVDQSLCSLFDLALRAYGLAERLGQGEIKVLALQCKLAEQKAKLSDSARQSREE